jgi:prepilin peptidase CpaA
MLDILILVLFPGAMAFAACSDLVTMTISNRVSLALVAGFLVMAPWIGMDLAAMGSHAGAGAAMLVVGFAMFAMGWIGGGDAKLFAATSLWFGWSHLADYAFIVALLGGALTLALLLLRTQPLPAPVIRQGWISRLHHDRGDIPYGIALAAGGLLIYPQTAWMAALA